jgi:hypothetical protein
MSGMVWPYFSRVHLSFPTRDAVLESRLPIAAMKTSSFHKNVNTVVNIDVDALVVRPRQAKTELKFE